MRLLVTIFAISLSLVPLAAEAHQPYLVEADTVQIAEPEMSAAYYGELSGEPARFFFETKEEFGLYVGILAPDIAGARTDFTVNVIRDGEEVDLLVGGGHEWKSHYEIFAGDSYLKGPELDQRQAEPGRYEIVVRNADLSGKYALAVGKREVWGAIETMEALSVIPRLKVDFFGNKTAAGFLFSVFGVMSLVLSLLIGAVLGSAVKKIVTRKLESARLAGVIGPSGRIARLVGAVVLLGFGLVWWCMVAFAASGFMFYESATAWCPLKAFRKN